MADLMLTAVVSAAMAGAMAYILHMLANRPTYKAPRRDPHSFGTERLIGKWFGGVVLNNKVPEVETTTMVTTTRLVCVGEWSLAIAGAVLAVTGGTLAVTACGAGLCFVALVVQSVRHAVTCVTV